jgi:RimJ/RimL family protein N-acetyltransferase
MENRLYLHVPSFNELYYRKQILSQPHTMAYNRGYQLGLTNYDNKTGCIDFRNEFWNEWYSRWISNEPERFYAYITDIKSNNYIGEVSFRYNNSSNSHCIGIVIEAKYRGKGYCAEGLIKLAEKAFEDFGIDKLRNDIPIERKSAILGHKKAGFKEIGIAYGNCILELSKDEYLKLEK